VSPQLHRGYAGAAGEYAVASELSRRGWLATVTRGGSPAVDVLAWRNDQMVAIQVKTASPGRKAFQLKMTHEDLTSNTNEWFAFVKLSPPNELKRPTFHLVPRNVVAALLFGVRKGAEAQGKTVGSWRNFLTEWVESYAEAWDAISTPTDQIVRPVRAEVAAQIATYGRPRDRLVLPVTNT
jgi:hypothetical protein